MKSPSKAGFRAVAGTPALVITEVVWRWCFGLASLVLLWFGIRQWATAVTVSREDELLLGTMQPLLMSDALAHMMREAMPVGFRLTAVLLPSMAVLWVVTATVGRASTLAVLLERVAAEQGVEAKVANVRWSSMAMLHFLRVVALLALILGYAGASVVSSRVLAVETLEPNIFAAVLIFLAIVSAALACWSVLNWFLSLAAIYVMRDGVDSMTAIAASAVLFRRKKVALAAVASINGLARSIVAVVASVAATAPLMLAGTLPNAAIIAWMVAVTLLYFVVSDGLLLVRLAGYVAVAMDAEVSEKPAGEVLEIVQPSAGGVHLEPGP